MPEHRFKATALREAGNYILNSENSSEVQTFEINEDRTQLDITFNETSDVFGFIINARGEIKIIRSDGRNYYENESENDVFDERIDEILEGVSHVLGDQIEEVKGGGSRKRSNRTRKQKKQRKPRTRKN